jgi:MoaA/NifB/PqqE/SkfB family radical SAM enzyme
LDKPLSAPLSITLNVTEGCNLSCVYCFARTVKGNALHMPAKMVVDLVKDLNSRGVWRIVLGGGEPFLHPDILVILSEILASGTSIAVVSNGIPIRKCFDDLVTLAHSYHPLLKLQISVDGPTAEIHDRNRGHGVLVFDMVKRLAKEGMDLQLATVITRHNVEYAHGIVDEFYPSVKQYHYMHLMPSRQLWESEADLWPDPQKVERLWDLLHKKKRALKGIHISIPDCGKDILAERPTLDCPGCTAGFTRMDINANGDVMACNMAYRSRIGNLYKSSFEKIWFSERANQIREVEVPLCRLPDFQLDSAPT